MMLKKQFLKYLKLISTISICMVLTGCFDQAREAINADFQTATYESLHTQLWQLSNEPRDGFDISLGISNNAINDTVQNLVGVKIHPTIPPEKFPDVYARIESVKLHSNIGVSDVELDLKLVSKKRHLSVSLRAKGALFFDNDFDAQAEFIPLIIKLRDIKSKFSWRIFKVSNSDLLDDFVTVETIKSLEDSLKIRLPRVLLGGPLIDLNDNIEIDNDDPPAALSLQVKGPNVRLYNQTYISALIFGQNGITIYANFDTDELSIPPVPSVSPNEISLEISKLRVELKKAPEITQVFTEDATVTASEHVLDKVLNLFNFMSKGEKRINIGTSSHSGKIFQDKWRDDILGEGGIYAKFTGSNPVKARIDPGPLNFKLSDAGLDYSLELDIVADAKVKTHFDPIVGGGVGKVWSLKGKAKPVLKGNLNLSVDNQGSTTMVVMQHTSICSKFDLTVVDSGDLKVGVKTRNLIGNNDPSVETLLDGLPTVINLKNVENTNDLIVSFPNDYLLYQYRTSRALLDENGLTLGLDLNSSYTADPPDLTKLKRLVSERLVAIKGTTPKVICPETGSMEVLIAGIPFGENNEFVKVGSFLVKQAKTNSKNIINNLNKRQKNLLNPPKDSALHTPAKKPLKTVECVITFFNSCK